MAHAGVDGSRLAVNQRLCGMLGYTREELMGVALGCLKLPV